MINITKKIHMIGMAGEGMSGIAQVLNSQGYSVQGSDLAFGNKKSLFESMGIKCFDNHDPKNIQDVDIAVYSGAIPENNIELLTCKERNVPLLRRAEMLAELLNNKYGIAVSGSHGKTTTTSIIAFVLSHMKLDPTFVIGGKVSQFSSNANLGKSDILVVEADESDGSFLHMKPKNIVITNIDNDHLDHFDGSIDNLRTAFREFALLTPFDGLILANGDSDNVRIALKEISRKVIYFGENKINDYTVSNIKINNGITHFDLSKEGDYIKTFQTKLLGKHNIFNALPAIIITEILNQPLDEASKGLALFEGVDRRLEFITASKIKDKDIMIYSDYAHHPTEIKVTLKALRENFPDKKIISIFQPHRYSRTHLLLDEFAKEISKFDSICLVDIYPAGENNLFNVQSEDLRDQIYSISEKNKARLTTNKYIYQDLEEVIAGESILVFMGAGDIHQQALNFKLELERKCIA